MKLVHGLMPGEESQACVVGQGCLSLIRGNKGGNGKAVTLMMNSEMKRIDSGMWKTVNYYGTILCHVMLCLIFLFTRNLIK